MCRAAAQLLERHVVTAAIFRSVTKGILGAADGSPSNSLLTDAAGDSLPQPSVPLSAFQSANQGHSADESRANIPMNYSQEAVLLFRYLDRKLGR